MLGAPVTNCANCPIGAACERARERYGCVPLRAPAGALIAASVDREDRAYFIREGALAVCTLDIDGRESTVALRGPRSLLFSGALSAGGGEYELRALTELAVCVAPTATVRDWVGAEGTPGRAMFELLYGELASRQQDAIWRSGDSLARVARFLSCCGGEQEVPLLQKQLIARILGMRPETFSRCLKQLVERGLVDDEDGLRVLDRDALAEAGQGTAV